MDETKVQIGEDVLLDIGIHSDWYISSIGYDGESVDVALRRKADRNKEWWLADTPQTETQTETQNSNLTFEKRTMRDCYNCRRYETEGECVECKFEPKDEPQTSCKTCRYGEVDEGYVRCAYYSKATEQDEPQTDWHYDEQDATWYPYKHEDEPQQKSCATCKHALGNWDGESNNCGRCCGADRRFYEPKDEPQTNADQHAQHIGSVESVEPTWTKEEHEAFYTFLWNVVNPNEMQDYIGMFEAKDEPQTDGYMTAEQTEDYRKMLDKAEHKVYGNIEDEPQTEYERGYRQGKEDEINKHHVGR